MIFQKTPSTDTDEDAAIWLQQDSAYLYREADKARDSPKPAYDWVARSIQASAAHSAWLSRTTIGIEEF